MAAGLPVVLLLHVLGGIDLRLIALCYVGFASSILFLSSLAIWISAEAPDIRLAYAAFLLGAHGLGGRPVQRWRSSLPRFGIRMPEWVAATNAWLVLSSPIIVAFHLATGLNSWAQLSYVVGRMIALQLLGAVFLTIGAIARLRSAHRTIVSGDRACPRPARAASGLAVSASPSGRRRSDPLAGDVHDSWQWPDESRRRARQPRLTGRAGLRDVLLCKTRRGRSLETRLWIGRDEQRTA